MMVGLAGLTDGHQELGQGVGTGQRWEKLTKSLEILATLSENLMYNSSVICYDNIKDLNTIICVNFVRKIFMLEKYLFS